MILDRSKSATRARHADWYQKYVYQGLSTHQIASMAGLNNHTTVYNGILSHARRAKMRVARLEDLRSRSVSQDFGPRVDWHDFSWHVRRWREQSELTEATAAKKAGISRTALRNAEAGRTLEATTLLALCVAANVNPLLFFSQDKEFAS